MTVIRQMKRTCYKLLALFCKPFSRFAFLVITCLLLAGVVFFVFRVNPGINPIIPACSFHSITGLYCPGCGMTRSLHAILNGRFREAFSYNPLWPFFALLVFGSLYFWFYFLLSGKNPFDTVNRFLAKHPYYCIITAIVIILFWVLRNIPVFPFTVLAPAQAR